MFLALFRNSSHNEMFLLYSTNKQEIIEFPAVLLNCHTGKVEDEFQFYCRPVINPSLTDYCIKLTGITQVHFQK